MILNTFKKYLVAMSLFVLPLLLANQYYIDDMGRASAGYTKWGVDGRPIADMVMSVINLSSRMADLAPLPLVLSVVLLSLALSFYRKEFIGSDKWGFVIPLAFLANPAIISLFSYRFDVFTFTFAISVAISIFVIKLKNVLFEIIIGSALIIIVMGTYQAVINFVSLLLVCEIVKNISRLTDPMSIVKTVLIRLAQITIGGVIYAKIVLPNTFTGGHSTNHPGISNDIIYSIKRNIYYYFDFAINNFYRSNGLVILVSFALLCVALTAVLAWDYKKHFKGYAISWIIIAGALVSSLMALPLTMGALLLLEKPLGGVHLYMSVSGFYLLLSTLIYYCSYKVRQISSVVFLPLFYAYTLMYAYGNSLQAQEKINNSVMNDIQYAINSNGLDVKTVIFNGQPPRSDIVKNAAFNYPILKYTVIDYFWNWYWGSAYLSINGINQSYMSTTSSKKYLDKFCKFETVYSSLNFNSYYSENILIVDFSKKSCSN